MYFDPRMGSPLTCHDGRGCCCAFLAHLQGSTGCSTYHAYLPRMYSALSHLASADSVAALQHLTCLPQCSEAAQLLSWVCPVIDQLLKPAQHIFACAHVPKICLAPHKRCIGANYAVQKIEVEASCNHVLPLAAVVSSSETFSCLPCQHQAATRQETSTAKAP